MKILSIYYTFLKQQIKTLMEYRVDFYVGLVGMSIHQIAHFMMLLIIFTQIKSLGYYSFNEILFLYGFSQIIRGLDHLLNDNIWDIGWNKIKNGTLSQILLRPIHPLQYVLMEKVQFDGLGEILIGAIIFFYAKGVMGLSFSFIDWIALIIFIIAGLIVYFAIKLLLASTAFWTVSSGELMTLGYEINSFSKYPLDIYNSKFLLNTLMYIIPFGMVCYVPMMYFMKTPAYATKMLGYSLTNNLQLVALVIGITSLIFLISLSVWNYGLKKYEPTGT